jgi:hypothetical protein
MILGLIQVKKSWIKDWGKAILILEKIRGRNGKSSAGPILIGLTLLASSCTTYTPPRSCKAPPLEKIEAARVVRALSLERLKSYQIGTTTEEDFLRSGWRPASIARPYGDIGISGSRGKISAPEMSIIYSEYDLGYVAYPSSERVKVCTLHFDDTGLLRSVFWNTNFIQE